MSRKSRVITLLCICLYVCGCIIHKQVKGSRLREQHITAQAKLINEMYEHVPTFAEIQEKLVRKGYDIGTKGIDGNIGEATKLAWSKAICQQYADKEWRLSK